jgi:hypothetical protein
MAFLYFLIVGCRSSCQLNRNYMTLTMAISLIYVKKKQTKSGATAGTMAWPSLLGVTDISKIDNRLEKVDRTQRLSHA